VTDGPAAGWIESAMFSMITALLVVLSPALAGPWHGTVGVDWTPLGRSDLAWVDAGQLSGTLVAATDGMLAPPLALHLGVTTATDAVLLDLGLGRLGTTDITYDGDGAVVSEAAQYVMGLRLGADYRRYLRRRVLPGDDSAPSVSPYLQGGGYAVIPSARRADTSWTADEQTVQDSEAGGDRARIGAVGFRVGGGAEACFSLGACVGLRGLLVVQRSQEVGEGYKTVSTLATLEPALTLDLAF